MNIRLLPHASLLGALAVLLAASSPARSQVLLSVDFGNGAAYTGTNTPYNVAADSSTALSFTQVMGNGTYGGYGLTAGRDNTATAAQVALNDAPSYNWTTLGYGSGIFDTNLTNDAETAVGPTTAAPRSPVGFELSGLTPGTTYTAYLIPTFSSTTGTATTAGVTAATYYGYALNSSTNYSTTTSDVPIAAMSLLGSVSNNYDASWVTGGANSNYLAYTFTPGPGQDYAYFAFADYNDSVSTTSTSNVAFAGFILTEANTEASIPEPSTFLLTLAGLGVVVMIARRRHLA